MDCYLHSVVVAALLSWTPSFSVAAENSTGIDCELFYMEQPTSSHSCNPYVGRVRLNCALYREGGLRDHTIKWYRQVVEGNVTQEPELLQESPDPNYSHGGRLLLGRLAIGRHASLLPGDYWCQAVLNGGGNSSYTPSASFRLLPEEEYTNYPPCNNLFVSQQKAVCARNGVVLPSLDSVPVNTSVPCGSDTSSPLQLTLTVSGGISALFLATVLLLLCIIFYLQNSKNKLRNEHSKPVSTSNEELRTSSADNLSQTSHQNSDNQQLTNDVQPPCSRPGLENSGYIDLVDSSITVPPVDSTSNGTSLSNGGTSRPPSQLPVGVVSTVGDGQAFYCALDTDMKDDEHNYTDRRKPPPVAPRKPALKAGSLPSRAALVTNKLAVLVDDPQPLSSEHNVRLPPKRARKDLNMKILLNGTEPPSSDGLPPRQYQALSPNTTDLLPVYTSPARASSSPNTPTSDFVYHYAS